MQVSKILFALELCIDNMYNSRNDAITPCFKQTFTNYSAFFFFLQIYNIRTIELLYIK